jgi:hypothetical protein
MRWLQMRSAFWRGVSLLGDSNSDGRQCRGSTEASLGTSKDTEGFSEVPKNVSLLEPVIDKLIDKVADKLLI